MIYTKKNIGLFLFIAIIAFSCQSNPKQLAVKNDSMISCMKVPSRFAVSNNDSIPLSRDTSAKGMKLIPGGTFNMGGDNDQAS